MKRGVINDQHIFVVNEIENIFQKPPFFVSTETVPYMVNILPSPHVILINTSINTPYQVTNSP